MTEFSTAPARLCLRRECEHHEQGWARPAEQRPVYAAALRAGRLVV